MEKVPVAVLPCRDRTRQLLQHSGCHWFPGTRCLSNHGREAHALCAALLKGVQVSHLHLGIGSCSRQTFSPRLCQGLVPLGASDGQIKCSGRS